MTHTPIPKQDKNKTCCEKCMSVDGSKVQGGRPLFYCGNENCPCHLPETFNYNDHSHYHCWEQVVPACGINKENHRRCCLCEKEAPTLQPDKGELPEAEWSKDFDEKFPQAHNNRRYFKEQYPNRQDIKSFIRNLLLSRELPMDLKGELPEDWEKDLEIEKLIVGKNIHSVYHICPKHGTGIDMPLQNKCVDCKLFISGADVRQLLLSRELPPAVGVSQWKKMGLELGYWAYFEKEVRGDLEDEIVERVTKWNSSGFMSDCLGKKHWNDLISLLKGK